VNECRIVGRATIVFQSDPVLGAPFADLIELEEPHSLLLYNARVQLQRIQIRERAERAPSIAILCQLQRSLYSTVAIAASGDGREAEAVSSRELIDGNARVASGANNP
jgi:hypothetical protein